MYMEAHPQWPYADVVPYITSELLWDPRQDVDALLGRYFSEFYGLAASSMRDYYQVLETGYERWLAKNGHPHWFGKDISSYHQNKLLEQYRVLSPAEANLAAALLQKAARQANGEPVVLQRIEVIAAQFELQKLALEQGWAAMQLRDANPQGVEDVRRLVQDARWIYDRSRSASHHIHTVLEKPPLDRWKMFRLYAKPLERYEQLKSGTPGPEIRTTIANGLYAAEEYLRNELGGNAAAAWWRTEAKTERVPALKSAWTAAEQRALAPETENLLADPGFEQVGQNLAAKQTENSSNVVLDAQQVRELGIHMTFPDRTPYRCELTTEKVHLGQYALMLQHCSRARVSRHITTQPGNRYRAGLWFRHDDGPARRYVFVIDVRLKSGDYRNLARLTLPQEPKRWRQYVAEVVAPDDATTLFLRLYAENQAADARCWIDDLFIDRG
jgi:hypothetical protein